jgi:hypothetical protein
MTDQHDKPAGIGRRELLTGAGLAVAATALARPAAAATPALWDHETDVVCVGSGAAACGAAVTAVGQGAQVIMVEKMPLLGGTTAKSGGVTWIPNNPILRARGLVDRKEDCLQYLARYAYPQLYSSAAPLLGLPEPQYRLLEAFYDNGSRMLDNMQRLDAVHFKEFRLFQVNRPAPDYADHLPENKVPNGRSLEPAVGSGSSQGGGSLAAQLEAWLRARNVQILTEHRVQRLIKSGERVIGVEAQSGGKVVRIKARRGVVFGTGGYAHNTELIGLHQTALYGSCAASGSTGDFIPIAQEAGARMGSLHTAWRTQVLIEEALENRMLGFAAFVLPGDSMIVVNKYGKRVVNEKRDYNDRTMTHFVFDRHARRVPNHLLYLITDARSLDAFGGAFPFPRDKRESRFLIEGATIDELTANIGKRLTAIATKTGGEKLAPEFATSDEGLDRTIQRLRRQWPRPGVRPWAARLRSRVAPAVLRPARGHAVPGQPEAEHHDAPLHEDGSVLRIHSRGGRTRYEWRTADQREGAGARARRDADPRALRRRQLHRQSVPRCVLRRGRDDRACADVRLHRRHERRDGASDDMKRVVSRTVLAALIWALTSALTVATDADKPASTGRHRFHPRRRQPRRPHQRRLHRQRLRRRTGVSFSRDLVPVLRTNCATCHLTGSEAGNLALHPGAAYKSLVGVQSIESKWLRVKPGRSGRKLSAHEDRRHASRCGGSGGRMPYNMEPLDAATRGKFRDWVAAGAADN